ncbi:hypothetical protein FRC08_007526 [Ceratobasidium sp. 394]|nr:hypothetical protein FRC08_007526 [Ceratobasidium sp. 394]
MSSRVNIWGPEFSEYSQSECDPRPSEVVSKTEVANFYNIYGVTPLATLERLLLRCDPRTDTLDISSSTPLNMLIDIIRRYLAVSKQKIFKNYYGFLLVYHLVYVTCLAILKETNTLDRLLESLDPDMSWSDVSRNIAFAAQDRVAEASQNAASLGEFYGKFTQRGLFAPYNSAPATDTVWLARVIWEDRDSFLTLCLRGHLPGCALLLLLALEFLPPNLGQAKNGLLYLQDLGFRLYLVGSRRDQQNLQRVCVGAVDKNVGWPNTRNIFTSAEDSQTLARAYSGLLRVWRRDKSSTKLVPIRLMSFLSGFVLHMSELNRLATPQEHIDVMSTSFQFLWLVFEQRGRIPVADHSEMRHFATLVFFGLQ